jgi:guanylate kinase
VAEMMRRLHVRGSENTMELTTRLETARSELDHVKDFDHIVINDDFERALHAIEKIIAAHPVSMENERNVEALLETLRADIDVILERST